MFFQRSMDTYDLLILGGGSAGEYTASLTAAGGKRVALLEERLVGGGCPYFACMPSKAMLAAAELRQSIRRAAVKVGAVSRPLVLDDDREAYAAAVARRDVIAEPGTIPLPSNACRRSASACSRPAVGSRRRAF